MFCGVWFARAQIWPGAACYRHVGASSLILMRRYKGPRQGRLLSVWQRECCTGAFRVPSLHSIQHFISSPLFSNIFLPSPSLFRHYHYIPMSFQCPASPTPHTQTFYRCRTPPPEAKARTQSSGGMQQQQQQHENPTLRCYCVCCI